MIEKFKIIVSKADIEQFDKMLEQNKERYDIVSLRVDLYDEQALFDAYIAGQTAGVSVLDEHYMILLRTTLH